VACFNRGMAAIEILKQTVIGAGRVARSASLQVQGTAAPLLKQAARQVRSQLEQRRGGTSPSTPPATPVPTAVPPTKPKAPKAPAAPTPAAVAKNISPKPAAKPAPKKKPAKKAVPGAKLPVKRAADRPDPA